MLRAIVYYQVQVLTRKEGLENPVSFELCSETKCMKKKEKIIILIFEDLLFLNLLLKCVFLHGLKLLEV